MNDIQLDRGTELPHLGDEVYLDNAGAGLPLKSHLKRFSEDLTENLYGNPHSVHTHSDRTGKIVEGVREEIASFLHTDLSQYTVIFTAGTTSACKLLADSFCWGRGVGKGLDGDPGHVYLSSERPEFRENCQVLQEAVEKKRSCYLYLEPNHTSVVGVREGAKEKGGLSVCVREEDLFPGSISDSEAPIPPVNSLRHGENIDVIRLLRDSPTKENPSEIYSNLNREFRGREEQVRSEGFHLLAHPATCNFSGKKYPIGIIEKQSRSGVNICGVHFPPNSVKVFIDAAAALSSSEIDLSKDSPHFLAVSFYKLFGFPTGIGALLVRNDTHHLLWKKYFGGGTVWNYASRHHFHLPKDLINQYFEEGTISYQSILALYHGFETLKSLGLSISRISSHIFSLVEYTYSQLRSLKHYNGAPVLEIYTSSPHLDPTTQGHILSFNMLRSDGTYVGYSIVNKIANSNKISLRVGCFCNIGACQKYMSVSDKDMVLFLEAGHRCGDQIDLVNGVPTGAVRVSFGFYNTREDADRLLSMIKRNFIESQPIEAVVVSKEDTTSCSDKESVRITEICIYPIKSCAAMKVEKWPVCETGFLYDRTWAILDSKKVVIKQTVDKNLYRVQPLIDLESGSMQLSYPGMEPISFELNPGDDTSQVVKIRISGVRVQASAAPDAVNQWLSQALGYSVILVKQVSPRYAIDKPQGVVDKIPMTLQCKTHMLLNTLASARGMIKITRNSFGKFDETPQDFINRMRGNLVVDGKDMEAFEEHKWRRVSINGVTMDYVLDCSRCEIINIHATSLTVNEAPMIVIGKERDSIFGVQLTLTIQSGDKHPLISVGDEVVVHESV